MSLAVVVLVASCGKGHEQVGAMEGSIVGGFLASLWVVGMA
jgi:hypothetical protein